jgi:hypothetical protein
MRVKGRGKRQTISTSNVIFCNTTGSKISLDSTQRTKHSNQTFLKRGKVQHSKYVFYMNFLKRAGLVLLFMV